MTNFASTLLLMMVSFKGGLEVSNLSLIAQAGTKSDPVVTQTEPSLFNWAQLGAMGTISALLVWQITVSNPAQSRMVLESQERRERAMLEQENAVLNQIKEDRHTGNNILQNITSNFYAQLEKHREESARQLQLERECFEKHSDRVSRSLETSNASVVTALSSLEKSHNLLAEAIRSRAGNHTA